MDVWTRVTDKKESNKTPTKLITQTINLTGVEDSQAIEIVGQKVIVNCSGRKHNHGSSKVKLTSIVDYNWESRLYMGQLVSVHMSGKYIAYGIKVQKASQNIGIVRVASRDSEQRALLRGMKGQIQDIAFAYIPSQYILGCVDEEGSLFVHNVDHDEDKNIICTLLLHIIHKADPTINPMYHRILWCPYLPDEEPNCEPDEDTAKLLVLTQGSKAEMWNVGQVNKYKGAGPHEPSDIKEGFLEINAHKLPIIDAAFSPDGTALATASLDGDVKFFQVYMHNDSKPRCLHQWQPHDGKALSCLFFLDDQLTYIPDVQFWKFAITGCDNNSELKVWSCESWTCLQTIHFRSDPTILTPSTIITTTPHTPSSITSPPTPPTPLSSSSSSSSICLKAGLDNAAGYLILSDIQNRILYVCQIHKDLVEPSAKLKMISEFFLQAPILSYGIIDAGVRKLKSSSSTEDLYQEDVETEDGNIVAVSVRMYIVQPKSLQECRIVYQPQFTINDATISTCTESIVYLPDKTTSSTSKIIDDDDDDDDDDAIVESVVQSLSSTTSPVVVSNIMDSEITTNHLMVEVMNPTTLNLMTPDSFNSPICHDDDDIDNEVLPLGAVATTVASLSIPPVSTTTTSSSASSSITSSSIDHPITTNTTSSTIVKVEPSIVNNDDDDDDNNSPRDVEEDDPPDDPTEEEVVATTIVFQHLPKESSTTTFASGGSSPSREVQEIFSLNSATNYHRNEFYDDDKIDNVVENIKTENLTNDSHLLQDNNTSMEEGDEWPKIPIMKVDEVIKSEENRIPNHHHLHHFHQQQQQQQQNNDIIEPTSNIISINSNNNNNNNNNSNISGSSSASLIEKTLRIKMTSLEEQIQQQNSLLIELKRQIHDLTQIETTKHHTQQIKQQLAQQIDHNFQRHTMEQNKMLEQWMMSRSKKEREYQESLMSIVSQVIGNNIIDKLDTIITSEIKKHIIPEIIGTMEPLKRQLHLEMTQKLTTTDHLLKENLTKLVHSKSVMDVLGHSVTAALRPYIENCYKDTIGNTILPGWERTCQQMFQQIHDTFTCGTKEYTVCLETYLEKQRKLYQQQQQLEKNGRDNNSVVQHQQLVQTITDTMRTSSEHLANNLSLEIQQQIQKTFVSFQENIKLSIRQEVKDQIEKGFRNHAAVLEDSVMNAVKSRAVTPSPHIIDSQVQQAQIQQLIQQGKINAAFQQALSASDLSLVVYTCEKINPQLIFNQTPCLLQQNVLLSLIQQLSADMTNHTDIKYKYLEEAVMNLQTTNPMTREHMPVVLKELQRQLTTFINCSPNNKITRQMKMLLMATHSLIQ